MRKFRQRKDYIRIAYLITFVFLLLIAYLFPYSGDDWAWGSQIGLDRLNTWFDNYSGRYFGNLIVLLLTRSRILRAFCMAVCLFGIFAIINRLTGNIKFNYWLAILCILFMPVPILRQAVVWTSGFANYTTSIFLTLVYILYSDRLYKSKHLRYSKWAILPLFLLGVGNTLIVEHLTIYNVILGIWVLVYSYIRLKKIVIQYLAYSIGTVVGTIYMFMNPVYRSVAKGTDGYRSIGSEAGLINKAVSAYLNEIVQEGFLNNVFLIFCLALICVLIWLSIKEKLINKWRLITKTAIIIIAFYSAWSLMESVSGITPLKVLKWFDGLLTGVYVLAIFIFLMSLPVVSKIKIKLIFIFCSAGMMIAPLLVVTPIGSRCFFASYVMFIYLLAELFCLWYKGYASELQQNIINKFLPYCIGCVVILAFYLIYIFGTICLCDQQRIAKAKKNAIAEKTEIQVENLPYGEYVWTPNPQSDTVWEERFKLFYGIDEDIEIENVESHLN